MRIPNRMLPLDPLPPTISQRTAMIKSLRRAVAAGLETDCQALVDYIQAVATPLEGSNSAARQLKGAIAQLTPNQFPLGLIPGVSGTVGYTAINPNTVISGFKAEYQDQDPMADQVHHFAAFFQLGFTYGADMGSSAASWWEKLEGTSGNTGDINLGTVAARIGAYVASGVLPAGEVASTIKENLCK